MEGDPHRLSQILSNLLGNAAKFTPDGGNIRLTLERQGDEALLAVRDSGIGVPAAMQDKIFDMFAQADNPLDRGSAGLGVGPRLPRRWWKCTAVRLTFTAKARARAANSGCGFR